MDLPLLDDRRRTHDLEVSIVRFREVATALEAEGFTISGFERACKNAKPGKKILFSEAGQETPSTLLETAQRLDEELNYSALALFKTFTLAEVMALRLERDPRGKVKNFPLYLAASLSTNPEMVSPTQGETAKEFPWWSTDLKPATDSISKEIAAGRRSFTEIWEKELGAERAAAPVHHLER